jgi:hypothetical protein
MFGESGARRSVLLARARNPATIHNSALLLLAIRKNAPCSFPAFPKNAPCYLGREDSFEDVETLRKLGSNRIGSPCNFSKSPCKSQIAGRIRPRDRFASEPASEQQACAPYPYGTMGLVGRTWRSRAARSLGRTSRCNHCAARGSGHILGARSGTGNWHQPFGATAEAATVHGNNGYAPRQCGVCPPR